MLRVESKIKGRTLPATRCDADLYARVEREAKADFCRMTEIVRRRLEASYADGGAIKRDEVTIERGKRVKIDNAIREMELKRIMGEMIRKDSALDEMAKDMMQVRQVIMNWINSLPDITPEQSRLMEVETQKLFAQIRDRQTRLEFQNVV